MKLIFVGFRQVNELTEGKYQILETFIGRLEAKPDHLRGLLRRVKAGEHVQLQLVESTNKLPLWHKRPNVREISRILKCLVKRFLLSTKAG